MRNSESGQTFFEFIFLLLIMFGISFSFFRGTNAAVGNRWVAYVKLITSHDLAQPNDVQLVK